MEAGSLSCRMGLMCMAFTSDFSLHFLYMSLPVMVDDDEVAI